MSRIATLSVRSGRALFIAPALILLAPALARADEPKSQQSAQNTASAEKSEEKGKQTAAAEKPEEKGKDTAPAREDSSKADGAPKAPIEVHVIGTNDDALQKVPGSGAIVSAQTVIKTQPLNTGELLRRVTGVRVREEEGAGLRLNIGVRGLDPTRSRRVLLLEDGVPIALNPYGEPDSYYSTPVERIRAIEVVKGSGSILYGPQSVGGVVNFLTLTAPNEARLTVEGQLGQRMYRKALVRYGDTVGDTRFVAQAMYKGSDGIRDMDFSAVDAFGKVSFPTGQRGEATLKVTVYNETSSSTYVGLTQPMFLADPRKGTIAPDDRFDVRRYDVSLVHEQTFSENTKLRTLLFGYVTDRVWRRQNYDRFRDPATEYVRIEGDPAQPGSEIFFRDHSIINDRKYDVLGIEPVLQHRLETGKVRHTLTAGARFLTEGARRKQLVTRAAVSDSGDLVYDETHRTYALAAYAQDRIAFTDWLLVTPGVRVEHADFDRRIGRTTVEDGSVVTDTGGTSSDTSVLPGLGIVIGTPRLSGFAGIFEGYAPPRVSQAITPTGKDARLGSERSINYEVGVRASPWKWAKMDATLFLMSFQNQLVSGTAASGDVTELVNGGATRHLGGEVAATVKIGQAARWPVALDLTGQYTYSRATFVGELSNGKLLPYAPEHSASMILDVEHPFGIGAQVSWSYTGDQYADAFETVEPDPTGRKGLIPGYHALDLNLRFAHAKTGLTASLIIKNLLDDVVVVSRLPDGIFTGGYRQITGSIRWETPGL
jgi:Fe(3+) dicitrate transport protein